MARPECNTATHFPHFAKHGKGMFYIRNKYRNDGYSVWFSLLEKLSKTDYHFLDLSDEVELDLMAAEFYVTTELFLSIINDLVKIRELDEELWQNKRIIWNQKFIDNIQYAYEKRINKPITREELILLLSSKGENKPSFRGRKLPLTPSKGVIKPRREGNRILLLNNNNKEEVEKVNNEKPIPEPENPKKPKKEESKKITTLEGMDIPAEWSEAMQIWINYKVERKEAYIGKSGVTGAFNTLKRMCGGNPKHSVSFILEVCGKGWKGIFWPYGNVRSEGDLSFLDQVIKAPIIQKTKWLTHGDEN